MEALAALKTAERQVITGMNRSLQQREIDYTQRAGTPEQEFQLELRRHQAMADLLPVALGELRPQASAVQLIERYAETSRTLRAWSSALPWEKLMRTRSVPARISEVRTLSSSVAGPSVATILV